MHARWYAPLHSSHSTLSSLSTFLQILHGGSQYSPSHCDGVGEGERGGSAGELSASVAIVAQFGAAAAIL